MGYWWAISVLCQTRSWNILSLRQLLLKRKKEKKFTFFLIGQKQSPLLPAAFHLNKAFFRKQEKKTNDTIQPVTMSDQG